MKRRRRIRIQQLIDQSATPVYVVSAERRVVAFNLGCQKLTGWSDSDVVGHLCEFVTQPDPGSVESLTASLCPPAESFEGRIASVPRQGLCRAEPDRLHNVTFLPVLDAKGAVAAVLGIAGPSPALGAASENGASHELHAELSVLRMQLWRRFGTRALVCRSDGMLRVAEQLSIARATRTAVLIHGEPGTGREHVARAIHSESDSRSRSFVPLDCDRLAPLELQQALRRSFEAAREDDASPTGVVLRPGVIFLTQVQRLPRDLQQGIVEALRSDDVKASGLRLIATTTLDPADLAQGDGLRPDFYHLITPLCIAIPPLRERSEDLRPLAQHLLEELNRGDARQFNGFGEDVWDRFFEYNWPGNVDELLAVIRESRGVCDEPLIRAKHLPFRFRAGFDAQAIGPVIRPQVAALEPVLARTEKAQIEQALKQCRQNKSKAAELLGVSRPRLYRRMEVLGILDEPKTG